MASGDQRRRTTVLLLLIAILLALPSAAQSRRRMTVAQRKQAALRHFEKAQQQREALNGKPQAQRSRRDYQRVVDSYRTVYYLGPTSQRADDSVAAVAELLIEQGRMFEDPKLVEAGIGQYEFLAREYPGSRLRFDALFTIAQVQRQDLEDPAKARATFELFLKRYPGHRLADDAREAIKEMEEEAAEAAAGKKKKAGPKSAGKKPAETAPPKPTETERTEPAPVVAAETVSGSAALPLVTSIRHWSTPDYTRVAIDLEQEVKYEVGRVPGPDRIFFDLHDTKLASELVGKTFEVGEGFLRRIRVAQYQAGLTRVVLDVDDVAEYSAFLLPNPYRLIIDVHGKADSSAAKAGAPVKPQGETPAKPLEPADAVSEKAELAKLDDTGSKATSKPTSEPTFRSVAPRDKKLKAKTAPKPPDVREADPLSNGNRSLIRALGLKIGKIVVDAGHGGHDTGTIGPKGLQEKDLVLDVAMRLGKLLEQRLGAEVVFTREDDTFIPLETRTALANQHQADLFISIHANSSRDHRARGIETYYLNFTSSSDALEVAARENAVSETSVFELQDLVKKIAINEKIDESREFASAVQKELHGGLAAKNPGLRDRGVKKAPFVVLIGANMPSILAEISFVSNPTDEKRLKSADYRQRIADSLFKGVKRYSAGLSGVKVAGKLAEKAGE